ncbi:MAG: radical SAM protein [Candidatus Omnitrophica bacterium]|jgi:radical SAM protein with 4Fe4S-binding SPASM domain|nr:radical SAM protein [Candidatus Omnitrophota bacterium]
MKASKIKNPEIVFICPRFYVSRSFTLSLGVSYIQAYLLEKGIRAPQIAQKDFNVYSLVDDILKHNSPLVGITCYDTTYYVVKIISQLLKTKRPGIKIVVGGPTASSSDELIMNDCPQIDFCVRGEGEYTVYELIRFLRGGIPIEGINGLTYRKNKKIIVNPDRLLIKDVSQRGSELDILPSPYLKGILSGGEGAGLLTSRGCLFKCTYCSAPPITQSTVRYHSTERIISELRKIHDAIAPAQRPNYRVSIWDDNFASNTERSKQICKAIIDNKLNDLIYYSELRADRTDKDLLELLFAAGFRHVNFGLESAVPRILRNVKKLYCSDIPYANMRREEKYLEKIKENVKLAKAMGITPTVSVILGLPGETLEDGKKTVEFVRELGIKSYYHNHLILFPKTELYNTRKKFGLQIRKSDDILPCFVKHTYDIFKIPYGSNSFESKLYYMVSCYFTEVVFGSWGSLSERGLFSYPAIIFNNFQQWDNDALFEWIRKNMIISAPLCFIYRQDLYKPHFSKTLRRLMVTKSIPTRECYCLTTDNYTKNNIGLEKFKLLTKVKPQHKSLYPFSFEIISLSQADKLNFEPKQGLEKESEVIVSLETAEDVGIFKKLISAPVENPEESLLARLISLKASFVDGCRWLDKPCPALELKKMFVQPDNTIKPCMHGGLIGKVGQNHDKIAINLRKKFEKLQKERGCKTCPANNRCSKCFFPHPMSVREYCSVRRSSPHISKIIRLLVIMKDLELQRSMGVLVNV